jgi:hypothetical protein
MPALAPQGAAGPSVRQQAAANVKVPKGSSVTITHTAQPKTSSGKSLTASRAAAKVAGKAATQAAQAPRNLQTFNPLSGNYTTGQLNKIANNLTANGLKATLTPLVSQAQQIQNSEGTVANRYGQYTATGDQIMQGLQANAGVGALTADNQAAQAAQNTANAIDQTGAAAKALNGGYLDPQVAAALQNQSTYSGTVGGANSQLASQLGSSEGDFMTNLRGSAALQGIEGQGNIAAAYAKQLATNRASQDSATLSARATAKQLASTLGEQQFNNEMLSAEVGTKKLDAITTAKKVAGDTKIGLINAGTNRERANTSQFSASTLANYRVAALGEKGRTDYANEQIRAAATTLASSKATAQERQWANQDRIAWAKVKSASTPSKAAQYADVAQVSGLVREYEAAIDPKSYPKGIAPTPAQVAATLETKYSKNGALVTAAIELGQSGYITLTTQQALAAQGVNLAALPPAWLRVPVPVTLPAPSLAPAGSPINSTVG